MTPSLMVVCLGGLAGAGAVVCCDLDPDAEALDARPDGESPEDAEPGSGPPEPDTPLH